MALHLRQRPKMRWMVQDMTATKVGTCTLKRKTAFWGFCSLYQGPANDHTGSMCSSASCIDSAHIDATLHSAREPLDQIQLCSCLSCNLRAAYSQVSMDLRWQSCFVLQFTDGSFRVAFDKGALDALMGEDNEGAGEAGARLLHEVQRVLDVERGVYLCVTLVQPHVLSEFLGFSSASC